METNQPAAQTDRDRDALAAQRTLMAAERTLSAWIRTGLAGIGGGLAVARVLIFQRTSHQLAARIVGAMLIIWGAGVIIYALLDYRRTSTRLIANGGAKPMTGVLLTITAVLIIVAALVLWLILS